MTQRKQQALVKDRHGPAYNAHMKAKTKKPTIVLTTLTPEVLKSGLVIVNNDNPEWGPWTVKRKYDDGVWEISAPRRLTTLFESECRFWSIVTSK